MVGELLKRLFGVTDQEVNNGKLLIAGLALNEKYKDYKYEKKKEREEDDEGLF